MLPGPRGLRWPDALVPLSLVLRVVAVLAEHALGTLIPCPEEARRTHALPMLDAADGCELAHRRLRNRRENLPIDNLRQFDVRDTCLCLGCCKFFFLNTYLLAGTRVNTDKVVTDAVWLQPIFVVDTRGRKRGR